MNQHPEDGPSVYSAPPRFIEALRAEAHRDRVLVPEHIDSLILRQAHSHLNAVSAQAQRLPGLRWIDRLIRTAAIIFLSGLVWLMCVPSKESSIGLVRMDLDHNGRLDILDAFALARRLNQGPTPSVDLDYNEDLLIDDRDVEFLASRAVALGREEN